MKTSLLVGILFFIIATGNSQVNFDSPSKWITNNDFSENPEIGLQNVANGYYYLNYERQVNVETNESYYRNSLKITETSGLKEASNISVTYDPSYQEIIFHKIEIRRKGTLLNKLDKNKFSLIQRERDAENFIYDGSLTTIYNIEDVRKGDIIDYSYTIVGRNPIKKGKFEDSFILNYYNPIGRVYARLLAKRKLNFKLKNSEITPLITNYRGYKSYVWEDENVKEVDYFDYAPDWFYSYALLTVSEFDSWKEVINWGVQVYNSKNYVGYNLAKKIEQIKNYAADDGDKIDLVLDFVQQKIRYLGLEQGIGSYQPFSPEKVYNQRFGDCKDKSLLAVAMLKKMGFEAAPVLVNTNLKGSLKENLPSISIFDHCIFRVQSNNKYYFFDPTITYQGGDYSRRKSPDYKVGLVLDSSQSQLIDLPKNNDAKTIVTEKYILDSIGGGADLNVKSKYFGTDSDSMRAFFSQNGQKDITKPLCTEST